MLAQTTKGRAKTSVRGPATEQGLKMIKARQVKFEKERGLYSKQQKKQASLDLEGEKATIGSGLVKHEAAEADYIQVLLQAMKRFLK